MIKWRIYYGDGSSYDESSGKPKFAPKVNVQCISVNEHGTKTYQAAEDVGHVVLHDWDYYIYQEDTGEKYPFFIQSNGVVSLKYPRSKKILDILIL